MAQFCETLENRTFLSSSISTVTADYEAVTGDAGSIKAELTIALATYKADTKLIATDIKTLGKNKTNSADVGKLNKAVAVATGADSRVTTKLIAAGRVALGRAEGAFLADIKHPTSPNAAKLSKALTLLTNALGPDEALLTSDSSTGESNVDAALSTLVAANPTDTTLSTDVSTVETNQSNALSGLSNELTITNGDITTLVNAVS